MTKMISSERRSMVPENNHPSVRSSFLLLLGTDES